MARKMADLAHAHKKTRTRCTPELPFCTFPILCRGCVFPWNNNSRICSRINKWINVSLYWLLISRLSSRMGVSIEQYRQRIGCFARVASVLSSFKVRGYRRNTFSQQSKVFGTALRVIMRWVNMYFNRLWRAFVWNVRCNLWERNPKNVIPLCFPNCGRFAP